MDVEGGRLCCSARELSELYRELQLLRIKYDQLVDVFRKLTKSWPNRGRDGKLLKETEASKANEKKKSEQAVEPAKAGTNCVDAAARSEIAQLKVLDSILRKAQRIKLTEEELQNTAVKAAARDPKRLATEMCKKVTEANKSERLKAVESSINQKRVNSRAHHRPSKTRNALTHATKSASNTSRTQGVKSREQRDEATPPPVTVVRHRVEKRRGGGDPAAHRRLESAPSQAVSTASSLSTPATSVFPEDGTAEDGEARFTLERDGSKLHMPSRYTALQTTLLRHQEQMAHQAADPSTEAMGDHFVQRLLAQGTEDSLTLIELELARQEYQLLTEEVKQLSVGGRARDVVSVRGKLETLVNRASAVENKVAYLIEPREREKTQEKEESKATACSGSACVLKRESVSLRCGVLEKDHFEGCSLTYSSLSELMELVETEERLRVARIETKLLQFCTEFILPRHKHQSLSTTSIQILSELAGKPKPIFVCKD